MQRALTVLWLAMAGGFASVLAFAPHLWQSNLGLAVTLLVSAAVCATGAFLPAARSRRTFLALFPGMYAQLAHEDQPGQSGDSRRTANRKSRRKKRPGRGRSRV